MEKIIASRHFDLDEATKALIMDELGKIESEYHKLTSARVVLDMQKTWYSAEIVLRGKNLSIESRTKAHELPVAFAEASEKVNTQLRKHLDRVHDHHHTSVSELEMVTVTEESEVQA